MDDEDRNGDVEHTAEKPELFDYPASTRKRSEEGTVVAVRGGVAEVLMRRSRFCEGCGSCCVLVDSETMLAEADNRAGAKEGDRVVVDLPASVSIRAAYILYGIPLLAFFVGIAAGGLLGYYLFDLGFNVPLALLFGITFLVLSYIILARVYAPGTRTSSRYRLVITRILR
ncbi:MAG: SoxR reducing system RseC family protein [Actinomycetota bacterium]|nr:SoxR reducing system RseC family protein [Actinomycetota bacterium]MDD5667539.1 SoxR reducing system RseC family protein [Actinomycetota bacterium]